MAIDPKKIANALALPEDIDTLCSLAAHRRECNIHTKERPGEGCSCVFGPTYARARESAEALLSDREEMLSVLRSVEWATLPFVNVCPVCQRERSEGHAPSCRLAALLRGTT